MEPERRLSVDGEPGLLLVLQQQLKDTPGRLSPLLRRQTVRMGQEYGSPLDRKAWGGRALCGTGCARALGGGPWGGPGPPVLAAPAPRRLRTGKHVGQVSGLWATEAALNPAAP